jgi:formamidopyrimidine-DNA glycosylase
MPELPEVHTTATSLNRLLPGLKIKDVWTSYGGVMHRGKNHIKDKRYFSKFKKEIIGQGIKSVSRRGKNILINLAGEKTILVHMKMTGHLLYGRYVRREKIKKEKIPIEWNKEEWVPKEPGASPLLDLFNRFVRLVFTLSDNKHLVLSDVRKFAMVCLVDKDKSELETLGPEPLEKKFNFSVLKNRLNKRPNGKIKQVLMDQEIIAGVGNIYSDEILWLSGVHPEALVSKIPQKKMEEIYKALKIILRRGIKFNGDSTSDYRRPDGKRGNFQYQHKAYQKTGGKCQKKGCQGVIKKLKVGGRSAHFCSEHQRKY